MNRLFTALAVALLLVCSVSAAVPVAPAPNPKPQFFTKSGTPCAACTISTFAGGTTTPLATYTDSTGTVTNPVIITLDSAGYPPNQIQLGAFTYKFVFKDSLGVTIYTVDNIRSLAGVVYPDSDTTFSANILPDVNDTRTIGSRSSGAIKGFIGYFSHLSSKYFEGVRYANEFDSVDINNGINLAGADCSWTCKVIVPSGTYTSATSVNIPLYSNGKFRLVFDAGVVLTYSGSGYAIDMNEIAGVGTASNLEISGYGAHIIGTSSALGAFHLLPTNGIKVHGFLATGFTTGACFQADGAEVTDIYDNHCEGNKYGWYAQTVGCRTTAPYDCSPSNTGAGFNRYDVNHNDVHDNILVGTNWGIFEDGTSNGSTLGNKYDHIDTEGSGSAGSGFGAVKLANSSFATKITNSYFENSPHYIVGGIAGKALDTATIVGNHFTTPNTAGKTIELVNVVNSSIFGNDELNPTIAGACFIDITTATNNYYGFNKISSTNQFCNAGVGGPPTDLGSVWFDVLNANRMHVPDLSIANAYAIYKSANQLSLQGGTAGFQVTNNASNFANLSCDDAGVCSVRASLAIAGGSALNTTNATGTGNLVKATSPTITTPTLSSPTITAPSITGVGSAGQAICWKTASTLGFCSTTVGAGGACTCN